MVEKGNAREAARLIKVIAFDVDGVLTDGRITYSSSGDELKSFHVRDGHAIKMGARAGISFAIITGRQSQVVERRAAELGIRNVYQGVKDKLVALDDLMAVTGSKLEEIAYMGDDVVDIPVMRKVGLAAAVADAPGEVTREAHVVTDAAGGQAAARELIVLILKEQGLWDSLMERYLK
jgi:YrbI family 3-deoxy-D-manno-octulosonate 8-phosphate phosphatase